MSQTTLLLIILIVALMIVNIITVGYLLQAWNEVKKVGGIADEINRQRINIEYELNNCKAQLHALQTKEGMMRR